MSPRHRITVGRRFADTSSCERRESRAAARSQAGAPLSWTSEGADTSFVCERARKAAAKQAPASASGSEQWIRSERSVVSSASDDDGGGFWMFAPPICRRRWRNNAFPFRQIRRRRGQPSEHRSEQIKQSAMREQLTKIGCERRESRAAGRRRRERRRSFLCERRRRRRIPSAMREQSHKKGRRYLSCAARLRRPALMVSCSTSSAE